MGWVTPLDIQTCAEVRSAKQNPSGYSTGAWGRKLWICRYLPEICIATATHIQKIDPKGCVWAGTSLIELIQRTNVHSSIQSNVY